MKFFYLVSFFLLANLLLSCQSTEHHPKTQSDSALDLNAKVTSSRDVNFITQDEARQRAALLSQVHYQLQTDLTKGDTNFSGHMIIEFLLSDNSSDLKVDLTDAKISKLMINKNIVSDFTQGKRFVLLPKQFLVKGSNQVVFHYEALYSHSGEGLHRFIDPEDKGSYLYTQFEAFDANRFMPCFDQPDLKAKMQLSVLVPRNWKVISNTIETEKHRISKHIEKWIFPDTALMSTYLFALHAGEYTMWQSNFEKVPLRLFARRSLAKFVVPADWFRITKQGLKFYKEYFGLEYPFGKYDQVIVPEFNAGAMENVAAVTFSERMVARGIETRNQKASTAETILHEMAHMWFGDLVTMKWWNDLWLNESFADFMENLAAVGATEYTDAGMDVFSGEKQWAYHDDQLVTTHPIEANVKNTDESFTNFDGITYGKGAAVFKQLSYTIGAETFQKGVQNYFKKYAYKNTELADFMGELGLAAGQDLHSWSRTWLQDAGLDTLGYQLKCDAHKVTSLKLEIENSDFSKQSRTHAFEIAFLNSVDSKMKVTKSFRILIPNKKLEVQEAIGADCPALLYPNYGDHAYLKFKLDAETLANLKTSFSRLEDPMMRLMFSSAMWQMVRDQKLKIGEYSEMVLEAITSETNDKVLRQLVASISGGRHADDNSIYFFMPTETEAQIAARTQFVARVETAYFKKLKEAPANSDLQKFWMDSLIHATETPAGLTQLSEIFETKQKFAGLEIDQDRRWSILQQMCKFNHPEIKGLVASEEKRDTSSRAKESSLACTASIPTLDNKKSWYAQVKAEKTDYSLGQIDQIARNIFPYQQRDLLKAFADDYFEFIKGSFARDQEYLSTVSRVLVPAMCNEKSANRIRQFVAANAKMPPVLIKALKVAGQEDERCAMVHAYNSP